MVVCQLVRIRNVSSSTFFVVSAKDPFYAPRIGDQLCGEDAFEIPPGFDSACEAFVVPWAATTMSGLIIGEVGAAEGSKLRCCVGPCEIDGGSTDWLRLHLTSWEAFALEHWLPLGQRHFLGAIGGVVELQLTFRDPLGSGSPSAADAELAHQPSWEKPMDPVEAELRKASQHIAECMHFERESFCAPANTVFLNVYDLASAASIPNAMLCNSVVKSFGAFHAAVEIYGEEWGFYRQADPTECGICRSRQPRRHHVHVYRQSVNLGTTRFTDWQVWDLIRDQIIPYWPGSRYDLIHCNCIHFAEAFAQLLEVQPVPPWVRGLHETGAALLRVPWPFSMLTSGSSGTNEQSQANATSGLAEESTPQLEGANDVATTPQAEATPRSGASGAAARTPTCDAPAPRRAPVRPEFLPDPLPSDPLAASLRTKQRASAASAPGLVSPGSAHSCDSFASAAEAADSSPRRASEPGRQLTWGGLFSG
mmetsp:Transcript_100316/g.259430  ORF Transcript_100316/g.259430 Transcript_100316/m.259430 type:complete len:479 (-) Transcript_100316:142-1578(-)